MKRETNDSLLDGVSKEAVHNLKINANRLIKEAKESEIPMFIAYYVPGTGYIYDGIFPEEIGTPAMKPAHGKFLKFLRDCLDFNKEDYMPHIRLGEK